ncbi:hypothetical protein [Nannocystis bainbridge]|uniref:Lipoprotein n=1 Tax=Nannocystis bainbridge TaxID=2995303 RepID=A0ABT5E8I2_9BACT|nr:hypothetical protein [Nannocystis bainbridge]MDC0721081.1 hypothetical protein [Nannocystis bainbridge]
MPRSLRLGLSLALLLAPACSPAPATPVPPASDALREFTATVQLANDPHGKQFHGVLLQPDDGEAWVVSYQPEPWLAAFADQRVRVTGEPYTPEGQALLRPHLRVHTLALVDPSRALTAPFVISVGPEKSLRGTFTDEPGDEPHRVFTVEGGATYQLANAPDDARPGQPQQIVAREVELAPQGARHDGPTLWVLAIQ